MKGRPVVKCAIAGKWEWFRGLPCQKNPLASACYGCKWALGLAENVSGAGRLKG